MMSTFFRNRFLPLAMLLLAGLMTGCGEEDAPDDTPLPTGLLSGAISSYIQGKHKEGAIPYALLGKGFDRARFNNNDVRGVKADADILDLDKIENFKPWDPFSPSGAVPASANVIHINETKTSSALKTIHAVKDNFSRDEFIIPSAVSGVLFSFPFEKEEDSNGEERYFYAELRATKTKRKFSFNAHPKDYAYYLSQNFVTDLKRLSANDLVQKYGTHVITSYALGATADILVKVSQGSFSEKEAIAFAQSLASKEPGLSLIDRFLNNKSNVEVFYIQTGSAFEPKLDSVVLSKSMFENGGSLRMDLWEERMDSDYDGFVPIDLNKQESNLIFIPDLINDLNYKVKYLSGILHQAAHRNVYYLLSEPQTYSPIRFRGKYYLYFEKEEFTSNSSDELRSSAAPNDTDMPVKVSPLALTGESGSNTVWHTEMNDEGLWTIGIVGPDGSFKYLCRDFELRTEEDDVENIRFWVLNPIISRDEDAILFKNNYVQ